jgi:hypothetical protein
MKQLFHSPRLFLSQTIYKDYSLLLPENNFYLAFSRLGQFISKTLIEREKNPKKNPSVNDFFTT